MSIVSNWSLKQKLVASFLGIAALVGAVGASSYFGLSNVRHDMSDIVDESHEALELAKLEMLMLEQLRTEKDFLLTRDEAHVAAHEKYGAEIDGALEGLLESSERAGNQQTRASLDRLSKEIDEYESTFARVLEHARAGRHEEAAQYSLEHSDEQAEAMLTEIAGYIARDESSAREHAAHATLTANRANQTILVVTALAVALAVAAGLFMARAITRPINAVTDSLRAMAQGNGDLTRRLEVTSRDEVGQLSTHFNEFVGSIHDLISQVRQAADQVSGASQELASASEQIASGAQQQASSIEETAASLEEITATVKRSAGNAQEANQLALASRSVADQGGSVIQHTVAAMAEISVATERISEINATVDEIAFQTNLLALNAAVEAARAGEQGRGFAVVAAEVRTLAQRSAQAAKEIKGLIQDTTRKVEAGSDLVTRSGETLREIVSSVGKVTDFVGEISAASREQATGIEQVSKAVAQMDQVTQSNGAQTEELSGTAQALAAHGEQLQRLVGRFKLENGATAGVSTASSAHAAARGPSAALPSRKRTPTSSAAPMVASSQANSSFEEF